MLIAIPVTSNDHTMKVDERFGRCNYFAIYDVEHNSFTYVENKAKDTTTGTGIQAASIVVDEKVEVVLAPRVGMKAMNVFDLAKITAYETQGDDVLDNIQKYKEGTLVALAPSKGKHS